MEAYRPGYQIDHAEGSFTHAALGPVVQDFALTLATPGAIAGTVTAATGRPVPVQRHHQDLHRDPRHPAGHRRRAGHAGGHDGHRR